MRVFVTGAGGFVGSNLAHVFAQRHGAEVIALSHETVDLTDRPLLRRCVAATRPDAIVHAAISNDPTMLASDRRRAWKEYVGATRSVVDAANEVDARVVLISTDWVFDGTQGPANETEPPNPVNRYGFLKAASELVVTQWAARDTVARIAGAQAIHRARPQTPRPQDAGFGYLVASLVDAVRRAAATTSAGSSTAAAVSTRTAWRSRAAPWPPLALIRSCSTSGPRRLRRWRVAPIPRDTRLDATITGQGLGAELPYLDITLARLRHQLDTTAWSPA